jgi:death-on-curing protein
LPNEPRWLPIEAVVGINQSVVAITGEPHFLRDRGLLESAFGAVAKRVRLRRGGYRRAGCQIDGRSAQAHAFEQGNKRTTFVAMVQFLNTNGYDLAIEDSSSWADVVIDLVEHRSTEGDFVRAIRPFVVPRP